MFTNRSTNEINLRVVFYGPGLAGKTTLLKRIYDATPEDQKGKMVSVETDTERTVFFDVQRPDFPEVEGARLRLHFYALSGQVFYAASPKLILKNADAVVFVADAQKERAEANIASFEELRANLSEHGSSLAQMPRLLCVTKCDLPNAEPPSLVLSSLGGMEQALSTSGRTGEGIPELMKRLVDEVHAGIVEGRLKEWQPSEQEERSGREFTARARLVGHYARHFGETVEEFNPAQTVEGRPDFIVVEHPPMPGRPHWTYATAGLSLWAQRARGPEPRLEFLAYSPKESRAIVDVLMVLAKEIHLVEETDVPFKTFDTVTLPGAGLVHEMFVLAPSLEPETLVAFPDLANRVEDVRFTHANTGNLEDSVDVEFIQVVPVLPDELDFATKEGSPALLEKMNLRKRGKDFGWNRTNRESVLRKGFLGLFS
jgi:GTPase SAR1 family protein